MASFRAVMLGGALLLAGCCKPSPGHHCLTLKETQQGIPFDCTQESRWYYVGKGEYSNGECILYDQEAFQIWRESESALPQVGIGAWMADGWPEPKTKCPIDCYEEY